MSDREQPGRRDLSAEVLRRLAGRSGYARYRVQGEVARGGMGAILRVWDEDLRRHLAMKVILGKEDPASDGDTPEVDPRLLDRFLEEAQITGQLDHPGIVPIHELGVDAGGGVYFTMKLVKGRSLQEVFELVRTGEEGWTHTRALGVLLKICEALAYAHDKGVIHRDLKPANVMVGRFGEVYVMDWGLARVLGEADPRDVRVRPESGASLSEVTTDRKGKESAGSSLVTMDGDVIGTPSYMSPEQARGDLQRIGPASDVYALGAILYELLAGHPPYVPPDARLNAYTIWGLVQLGPPTAIGTLATGAAPEVVAICEKAMSREPQERYPDTGALAADLRAFLEGRVVEAHRTGAWIELSKWVRRNRTVARLAGAVLVLVLVGVYTLPTFLNARLERRRNEEASAIALLDLRRPLEETEQSRAQAAVDRIAGRILAGHSTEEDRRRFVSASMHVSLRGDRYFRPGEVSVEVVTRRRIVTSEPLGFAQRMRIRLDGERIGASREATLYLLGSQTSKSLWATVHELGRHEVAGGVEFQLVRLPTTDPMHIAQLVKEARARGEEADSLFREGFGDPIHVPVDAHSLLVLETPPDVRPPLVRDGFLQDRFTSETSVVAASSSGDELTLSLRLPLPDVWLPVAVEVTDEHGTLHGSASATMGEESSLHMVTMEGPLPLHLVLGPARIVGVQRRHDRIVESTAWTDLSRHELGHVQLELHVRLYDPLESGARLGVRITPDEELLDALDHTGLVEEYALVEWEGSVEQD